MNGFYSNSDHAATLEPAAAKPVLETPPTLMGAAGTQPAATPMFASTAEGQAARPAATDDHVPENVRALREGAFFDADTTFREQLALEHEGLEPETLATVNTELRRMAGDLGLAAPELREVVDIARTHDATPPTAEQVTAWQSESETMLHRTYGPKAGEALNLARQLVARDARLGQVLDALNLGNHPRVVAVLVERARAERDRGRL